MANTMNNYFTTIWPSLAANMTDPWVYNGRIHNDILNDIFHVENDELYKLVCDNDITMSCAIEQ